MMTTPQLRILIVDDEPDRSQGWAERIRGLPPLANASVTALDLTASRALIEAADRRRRIAREGQDPFTANIPCALDDVDILIVDYDLQEMVEAGQWSTGLWVAMLARAFSRVKAIVLVNQFSTNMFDLTLLKTVKSHADFDIGSAQLLNPALWDRSLCDGYAPWSWGAGLLRAPDRLESIVEWTKVNLDKPVLATLGFSNDSDNPDPDTWLSQDLWQDYIGDPARTFREVVGETEFLTRKDREHITALDEPCARVASAIVTHWLERVVIPANDVLIDLPHLVSASPWLLADREDITAWQATIGPNGLGMLPSDIHQYAFSPGFPLSGPVIWRKKVTQTTSLAEPSGFTYDGFPDLVFCEDTSQFHPFEDSKPFLCRLASSDPQRFVANPERIVPARGGYALANVSYEPSVFFAL